jgi:hypothetical protein
LAEIRFRRQSRDVRERRRLAPDLDQRFDLSVGETAWVSKIRLLTIFA